MSGDLDAHTSPDAGSSVPDPGFSAPQAAATPDLLSDHPEVIAGAAFVGGLVTALIVRRLGH